MPDSYEGQPQQPVLYFIGSKDWAILVRTVPIEKDGIAYNRLYMVLPEKLKFRYRITNEICEKTQPDQKNILYSGKSACLVRDYKRVYFDYEGMNPEDPTIAVMCNFDGTEPSYIDINKLKTDHLSRENQELKQQNESLWTRILELQDTIEVIKRKNESGESQ